MDHRWKALQIIRTLDRVVSSLELYVGRSLLADAHAEAIRHRREPKQSKLHLLVYKERLAEPADLELMADYLPGPFLKIRELTSKGHLATLVGAASETVDKLRTALARSAQEYLSAKQLAYLTRLQAATKLREFIHELGDRTYKGRLHGFGPEHVEQLDKLVIRERGRLRAQRLRDQKKSTE